MNINEQKHILRKILNVADETIRIMTEKKEWLEGTILKVEELSERLSEYGDVGKFDENELIDSITNTFFENELSDLYELADSFRNEIDFYSSDLDEIQQETLEERYERLQEVCEKFDQSIGQYETIDNAIEHIEEGIDMLNEMLNK